LRDSASHIQQLGHVAQGADRGFQFLIAGLTQRFPHPLQQRLKTLGEPGLLEARFPAIFESLLRMAETDGLRPGGIHHTLAGIQADASLWNRLAIVPGHPR